MSLERAYTAARVIESAENYARAGVPPSPAMPEGERAGRQDLYYDDETFWRRIFQDPDAAWNTRFDTVDAVALSEWVARVPGLYWRPESAPLRKYSADAVEGHDLGGVTLRPFGKSQVVHGGVGTLKFPPSETGYRLGTVTMTANVSAGVPILIAPDVWEALQLREGAVVRLRNVPWVPMAQEWAGRFPSTRNVPRGCLVARHPDMVAVPEGRAGVQIHPFTIMEHTDGPSALFDFVFATGDTADPKHRKALEGFFDSYKTRNGRDGRYLIAADVAQPLWESDYASPQELSRAHPAAGSQLALLERRIREGQMGKTVTTELLAQLSDLPDVQHLKRISALAGIQPSTWSKGGRMADESAQFLAQVADASLPAVLEALAVYRMGAFVA